MGSATREALGAARAVLAKQQVDRQTAEDLFAVARVLGSSAQLRSAVADPTATPEAKAQLVERAFSGKITPAALAAVSAAASARWSEPGDIIDGLEELGIRAAARAEPAGVSIADELFAFREAVASDADLELALRSKLADADAKAQLVERVLRNAAPETRAIAAQIVRQPRGRSIREALRAASEIVADEKGQQLALVTSAAPLEAGQLDRLRTVLAARYGRDLVFNHTIDPSLIGGLRVQIGDDVIDSSIQSRLSDLRLALA